MFLIIKQISLAFLFQAIQFNQTVLIQTISFSISIAFCWFGLLGFMAYQPF